MFMQHVGEYDILGSSRHGSIESIHKKLNCLWLAKKVWETERPCNLKCRLANLLKLQRDATHTKSCKGKGLELSLWNSPIWRFMTCLLYVRCTEPNPLHLLQEYLSARAKTRATLSTDIASLKPNPTLLFTNMVLEATRKLGQSQFLCLKAKHVWSCIVMYSLYSDYLSQSHLLFGNLAPFPLKSDISVYFRFPEIPTPINVRSHKRFKSSTLRKKCTNKDRKCQTNVHAIKVMCLGECTFSVR